MTQLVAVNPNAHQQIAINPAKAELHGAALNLIPLVAAEFVNAAVQYPIVLTKNGDTGEFVFAGLLGFEAKENLFWQHEKWQGIYLPLQIQRQPFFVGENTSDTSKNNGDYVVCMDLDSPTIVGDNNLKNENTETQSLYTETGEDSAYFQQAKQCLAQLLQGEIDNNHLLDSLKKFDLLQPLALEITFANQKTTRLNGLYTINQDKLASLKTEQVAALHQQKLLQPIYTMIASLGQIYALIERKNARYCA